MPYRGHIVNGTVVLDEPVDVPDGMAVTVVPALEGGEDPLALATRVYDGLSDSQIGEIESIALDRRRFFGSQ